MFGVVREVGRKCMGSVWKVCWKRAQTMWEVNGKGVGSAREVSVEAVLEAVGSVELSPNSCKTPP